MSGPSDGANDAHTSHGPPDAEAPRRTLDSGIMSKDCAA